MVPFCSRRRPGNSPICSKILQCLPDPGDREWLHSVVGGRCNSPICSMVLISLLHGIFFSEALNEEEGV